MIELHPPSHHPDQLTLLGDPPRQPRVTVVRSHLRVLPGEAREQPIEPLHSTGSEALTAIVGVAQAERITTLLARAGWWIAPIGEAVDRHHTHEDGPPTEGRRTPRRITRGSTLHRALRAFSAHRSGLTSEQLDQILGTRTPTGNNRRLDLQQAGMVERTDITRTTSRGRPAAVYRVTEQGLALLTQLEEQP